MIQNIPQGVDYIRILPEIILSIFGMIIMVVDPLVDERHSQKIIGIIALVGSLAAIATLSTRLNTPDSPSGAWFGSTASASSSTS